MPLDTPKEIEARRRAFLRNWRLKCRAVADSLEEAGERLFALFEFGKSPMADGAPGDHREASGQAHASRRVPVAPSEA